MEENTIITTVSEGITAEENQSSSADYIKAIKEMRQNSVPRDEYNKIVEEKKQLVQALVNGEELNQQTNEPKPDIDALRKKLFNNGEAMSNMEYIETACDLRDALISAGEDDPFVPKSSRYDPTDDDYETAEKVARIYRECLDYANGDPVAFQNELMRRVPNDSPVTNARARR